MIALVIIYSLLFALLAHKHFRLALGLFIIGLPAYLIRFKIGPLPTTLLELNFGILFLIWLIKYARIDISRIRYHVSRNNLFFVLCSLFFVSSFISVFVSDMWYYSLGQWRAYFLEPVLIFVMLVGRIVNTPLTPLSSGESKLPHKKEGAPTQSGQEVLVVSDLIWFLALSTLSISIFGVLQYFTGWHIGNVDWVALQTGRVTSFFLSPNAVGLYLGPIVPLMFYFIIKNHKHQSFLIRYSMLGVCALALVTLLLARSLGALGALALGTLLFFFLTGHKKITLTIFIFALFTAISLSPHLLISKLQSTSNRLTLWSYSWSYLTQSPKNCIFGTGIRQFFRKIQKPYYDSRTMERLIYPHNIFLNFWTETGLLGMISFIALYSLLITLCYKIYKNSNRVLGASLLSALVVILIHGLVDVPYFKNDLSMLFWVLAAIVIRQPGLANLKA